MADIAALGFAIDSSPLQAAEASLNRFSGAAKQAEAAARGASAGATKSMSAIKVANDNLAASNDNVSGAMKRTSQVVPGTSRAYFTNATAARTAAAGTDVFATSAIALRSALVAIIGPLLAFLGVTALKGAVDTWSDLSARVKNAVGEMGNGVEVMKRLAEMARRTFSPLSQTAEVWLQNSNSLKELGYTINQQLDLVEAMNNALVISAIKDQRAVSVQIAWSKAMAKGKLDGDNLNTVIQSGGRLAEALADSMGVNVIELGRLGAQGKITTQVMFGITTQLEKLRAEADAMPATIADGFALIGNSFLQLVGVYDQTNGLSASVASGLVAVADNLALIVKLALVAGSGLLAAFSARLIAAIAANVAKVVALEFALGATSVTSALFSASIKVATGAVRAFTVAIASNPLGAFLIVLTMLITALAIFRDDIHPIAGEVATVGDYMRAAWVGIKSLIDSVWVSIKGAGNAILGVAETVISAISSSVLFAAQQVNKLIALINIIPGVNIGDLATTASIGADAALAWLQSWRDAANKIGALRTAVDRQTSSAPSKIIPPVTDEEIKALKAFDQYIAQLQHANMLTQNELAGLSQRNALLSAEFQLRQSMKRALTTDEKITLQNELLRTEQLRREGVLKMQREQLDALDVERNLLGATAMERAIANAVLDEENRLKKEGIDLYSEDGRQRILNAVAIASNTEELRKNAEAVEWARGINRGFFSDLRSGIAEGKGLWKSFGDAVVNVLGRIADRVGDMIAEGIFDALFGVVKSSGSGGGLIGSIASGIGSILGFASGGYTGNGSATKVAGVVHGQEFVMNAAATARNRPALEAMNDNRPTPVVAPVAPQAVASRGTQSPQTTISNTYYIDATGADEAAIARLEAGLKQTDASIEHRSVSAIIKARGGAGSLARKLK